MNSVQSLSHTKWECKYHVTWIPKYRKKQIYKELRKHLGEVLRDLARRKECKIRRSDSELYQVTRKRGSKDRTAEFVQVDGQR